MKKALLLLVTSFWLLALITSPIVAQEDETASPSAKEPAKSAVKSKVDEIKDKIASTVAQLNLVSKKAVIGEITKLEKIHLTIERNGDVTIIDVDELTKYIQVDENGKKSAIKPLDLHVGNDIIAIGLYNKDSRRLLARLILVKTIPVNVSGIVKEVDIKDGAVTIEDKKRGQTNTIDVERTTKISLYTKTDGITKSGLSKIEIGQHAHVTGDKNANEKNHITASRVLLLPEDVVETITPAGTVVTESTASASPTEKPSKPTTTPKPTKKPTPTPTEISP